MYTPTYLEKVKHGKSPSEQFRGFHRHQSKNNSEHTHCEKLLVVKVGCCKKWRPVKVAGFSNIFVICTEILERLRANQNRGNLGAGSWEEVHKPGSGTSDFRFAPPSPTFGPSSQLPAPRFIDLIGQALGAGSWEVRRISLNICEPKAYCTVELVLI